MINYVLKVGGSNLKNIESLEKVVSLVKSYNSPVIIVVSAFFKVTDKIIDTLENNLNPDILINELSVLHKNALTSYIKENSLLTQAVANLEKHLFQLKNLLNLSDRFQPAVSNKIISYGERKSATVIGDILHNNGVDCKVAFPEDIGLISNKKYFQGTILLKKSSANLLNSLLKSYSYVIPGFYGVSNDGETVLLGRGGTDYSAACIANCLNVKYLDVWKDVEGYLSADPKIIPEVKKINKLSYLEAAELSYFGAKILHPRTIRPLVKKGIAVRLFNPEKHKVPVNESTLIDASATVTKEVIKSITYSEKIALLKIKGSGVGIRKGILAEVTGALDRAGINIKSVVTSQTAINFIFSKDDMYDVKKIIDKIKSDIDFDTEIETDIAWIAAVGSGINKKEGIAARIFVALAKMKINVKQIVLGASETAIYFIVDKRVVKEAVRAINNELGLNK
jgi:aspartate kinase/aspartokinase/homoserine dehydrogenase 1